MLRSRTVSLLAAALMLAPTGAFANPQGGQVVGGSAGIQGQGTKTVTVTQGSQNAIINWYTFNIGAGENTQFIQPNSSAIALNRVTGGLGASQIFGALTANGKIFLINPNGILFGAGSTVNAAGFLASTNDIKNSDFMAGHYNFNIPGRLDASIVNLGHITASDGGFAALVAPGVRNAGVITANLGHVALASGNGFTLDFYGDKLITLQVGDEIANKVIDVATGQTLDALVKNEGVLRANGGQVALTAAAARHVVDSVINTTGVIEANTVGTKNGMIVLGAATAADKGANAPKQTVKVSGTLSAAGTKSGEKGGVIQITGENIALAGAKLDASGQAGGGTVLVGGDTGGGHVNAAVTGVAQAKLQPWSVANASTVSVDAATVIDASAKVAGDGGKVVVWSNGQTSFNGVILASGAGGGNGGFVETSGHSLQVTGSVNAGSGGTWLLDPDDLTIDATLAGIISTTLNGGTNVVETTSAPVGGGVGNITVDNQISWNTSASLTLSAYNSILVNASIVSTGGGAVTLHADNTGTGVGTVRFGDLGSISTSGAITFFYNPWGNDNTSVNKTSFTTPTDYSGFVFGGGPLTAYMLVNTVYDLQNVQNNLKGTYALGRNIDASTTVGWNDGAGFVPIGNTATNFTGTFDGQGHTINNLVINEPTSTGAVGLFGVVGDGGVIQNVGLVGGSVTGGSNYNIGALVGLNDGTVSQSYASVHVTAAGTSSSVGGLIGGNAGTVTNSYATGAVTGGSGSAAHVGGLIGQNFGTVSRSYATGAVSGPDNYVGGLVGYNRGTITESYATGTVIGGTSGVGDSYNKVGGLVGFNDGGTITLSYATGTVTGGTDDVGGLVGGNSGTVSQSYATGNVNGGSGGSDQVGGLIGFNGGTVTQSYATGAVNGINSFSTGGLIGVNAGSVSQSYATGAITGTNNVGGLVGSNLAGGGSIAGSYATGTVNGLNAVGGLVGFNNGIVMKSYATGQVQGTDGGDDVGGLVGFNYGGTVTQSYAMGNVSGPLDVGGLVGDNSFGTITQSYATGTVTGTNTSFGFGVGGLVGFMYGGSVTQSYATGAVSAPAYVGGLVGWSTGTISESFSSGAVSGSSNVGGFVGWNGGSITTSYWDTTTSGFGIHNGVGSQVDATGVTGLNTNQAMQKESYVGWDFDAKGGTWFMIDGKTRPFLQSEWSTTINNAHQLQLMAMHLDAHYTLANDVSFGSSFTNPADMWSSQGFVPIGQPGFAFAGVFDGQGHQIDGLKIASTDPNMNSIGLFGANSGTIENVHLTNVDIIANLNAGLPGQFVGTLVGLNFGLISNVWASGQIDGKNLAGVIAGGLVGQNGNLGQDEQNAQITNSHANVKVTLGDGIFCNGTGCNGGWNSAGGLVGFNVATIDHSSASGDVTVGAYSFAGGLVGTNQNSSFNFDNQQPQPLPGPSITDSWASGNVSSNGVGVSLGGLVGYNAPLAVIATSFALGNVTSTAKINPGGNDCSATNSCQWANVGGLVGQNQGEIVGSENAPSRDTGCGAGQTCATGVVTVGSGGTAGGLVGYNDGIILNAFATGNVVGAAGVDNGKDSFGHSTNLGGLVGSNQGWIDSSFASGNVGTPGVAFLQVGGLVGDNGGMISNSSAFGTVWAGDHSQAGGLAASNGAWDNNCTGCIHGDGYNLLAGLNFIGVTAPSVAIPFGFGVIANSNASGNVSVGDDSLAGGLVGSTGNFNSSANSNATIDHSWASGTVSGGGNSILGGLVGVQDIGGTISNSYTSAPSTVSSNGSNSIVGGFIGVNGGAIIDSQSSGAVNGISNSYLGGFVGINVGSVQESTNSGTVTASGSGNVAGGFVAVNIGSIDPSGSTGGDVQVGPNNIVGGFAGGNLSFPGGPSGTISGDSFTNDTVNPRIATTSVTSDYPGIPSFIGGCDAALCQLLLTGFQSPPGNPGNPGNGPTTNPPPPPNLQVQPPPTNTNNNTPIQINLTTGGSGPTGGAGGNGNGNGGNGNNGGLKPSFGPPPGPGLGRTLDEQRYSGVPPPTEIRFRNGEVVVQVVDTIPVEQVIKVAQGLGMVLISSQHLDLLHRVIYRFRATGKADVRALIRALEKKNFVASAQPNYVFVFGQSASAPAAPSADSEPPKAGPATEPAPDLANSDTASLTSLPAGDAAQYVIDKFHLIAVHRQASGRNVTIAVIDSEVDATHPDLRGVIAERFDATQSPSHPHPHGTGMAGAIAARYRLLGVAPGARILAIKAFDESASSAEATSYQIIKGLDYAIAKNVRIINMSFAGPRDPMMERTLKAAHDKGIILIAAAGNAGPKSPPLYPGADQSVIAVSATDYTDKPFVMANRGKYIAVAAPGVDVMVPAPGNSYQLTTGTSVAAAHVSGVAALLVERKPTITPDEVRALLIQTATAFSSRPKGEEDGAGLVDPVGALKALGPAKAVEAVPNTNGVSTSVH